MKNTCLSLLGLVGLMGALFADEPKSSGSAAKGRILFAQCAGCHNTDTNEMKFGPSLKGLFRRSRLHNGKPVTEANVRIQLSTGSKGMPAFADDLSERNIDDLLAYLKTL